MLEGLSKSELADFLCNAVNEQGYLLQEACAKAIEDKRSKDFRWRLEAEEYPVSLHGADSKIDIVLRYWSQWDPSTHMYAVLECKRADPSYVCWMFGSSHLDQRYADTSLLGYQGYEPEPGSIRDPRPLIASQQFLVRTYCAKWWLEAKEPRKTQSGWKAKVSTPQNIEAAFTQVLRGIGGLALQQASHRKTQHIAFKVFFVPVVVTTAPLYVAEYKTADIGLSSGTLDPDKIRFGASGSPEPEPWVQVQYGIGDGLTTEPIQEELNTVEPRKLLEQFKIRSIFVVNSSSLVEFLSRLSPG